MFQSLQTVINPQLLRNPSEEILIRTMAKQTSSNALLDGVSSGGGGVVVSSGTGGGGATVGSLSPTRTRKKSSDSRSGRVLDRSVSSGSLDHFSSSSWAEEGEESGKFAFVIIMLLF
jgi:hypothetical protein